MDAIRFKFRSFARDLYREEVIINPNTYVNLGATLEVKIEKNESSNTLIMYLCIGIITKDYLI